MKSTLEIDIAKNGEFTWRRKASGGRIIEGPVETYKRKATMMRILKKSVFCGWTFATPEHSYLEPLSGGTHTMKVVDLTGRK